MAGFPSFCLVSVLFCPILSTYSTHMDVIYSIIGIAKSRNLIRSGYILLLYRGDKRRDFRHSKSSLTIGKAVTVRLEKARGAIPGCLMVFLWLGRRWFIGMRWRNTSQSITSSMLRLTSVSKSDRVTMHSWKKNKHERPRVETRSLTSWWRHKSCSPCFVSKGFLY